MLVAVVSSLDLDRLILDSPAYHSDIVSSFDLPSQLADVFISCLSANVERLRTVTIYKDFLIDSSDTQFKDWMF